MIDKLRAVEAAKFIINKEKAFPGTYHHEAINEAIRTLEKYGEFKHRK